MKATGIVLTGMLLVGVSGASPTAQGQAGGQKKNMCGPWTKGQRLACGRRLPKACLTEPQVLSLRFRHFIPFQPGRWT